jgi:hypothetical protein
MTLAFLLSLPLCIELAGWFVDATFIDGLLHSPQIPADED